MQGKLSDRQEKAQDDLGNIIGTLRLTATTTIIF